MKARALVMIPLLALSLACAHARGVEQEFAMRPQGPGARFLTIEGAAMDALAHAHSLARLHEREGRMQGGVIRRVDGGYSYDEVSLAPARKPLRLEVTLQRDAVARFQTHPGLHQRRADLINEEPSNVDVENVLLNDPMHRPLFILTPTLEIKMISYGTSRATFVSTLGRVDERGLIILPTVSVTAAR